MNRCKMTLLYALCSMVLVTVAVAARPACENFNGRFAGTLNGTSMIGLLNGDLPCLVTGTMEEVGTPTVPQKFHGEFGFYTSRGIVKVDATVRLIPTLRPFVYRWVGVHHVIGGDRDFNGATGMLKSHGWLDQRNRTLTFSVSGQLCADH